MLTRCLRLLFIAALFTFLPAGCRQAPADDDGAPATPLTAEESISPPFSPGLEIEPTIGFPDFKFMPGPDSVDGRVFLLSQDYPEKEPAVDAAVRNILAIDFKEDWKTYALAVRDYILEGNADPDNLENSFYLEDNKVRDWYHVPWQHWGSTGREGYHGLTREGPIAKHMLAPTQENTSFAYAVGFYNDLGGYTIGKLWPDTEKPELDYFIRGGGFPVGTVVGKVLYTTLAENEVPYLVNPVTWNAYVYEADLPGNAPKTDSLGSKHVTAPLQLIQMDIMVRDDRAVSTGGWVFGTFVYNGTLSSANRWENLQPVGLMWGNDPDYTTGSSNPTPVKTVINADLKETIINPDPTMPAMHIGWGGRLNGPVDNALSSCMSCHSTGQYPVVSSILAQFQQPRGINPPADGQPASEEWMRWFRNVDCATAFDPGQAVSLDYSMQLQKSVVNYLDYQKEIRQGRFYLEYWGENYQISRNIIADSEDVTGSD